MQLYEDQTIVLAAIRQAYREGARAPILCAPTGFGKTVCFSSICDGAQQRGNSVIILVHRQELVDQVSATLKEFHVSHGLITPDHPYQPQATVQVASVFTLVRRLASTPAPALLVIDEAHHAILRSTWGRVISHYPNARLLGVTATPTRLSGEGLGDIFDRLVVGPSVQGLIDRGRLAPVHVYAPPTIDVSGIGSRMGEFAKEKLNAAVLKPKITGDAITHYNRHTPGQRAAVFCVSLEHAASVAQGAREKGICAVTLDGTMDKTIRREIIRDFSNGKIQWLVTVDLISEGFDCPGIEVGICLRPTQSLALWLQQCGRILRTAEGKHHATILDHAGNSRRHGLPTEDREWSLDGTRATGNGRATQSVRVCPKCWAAQRGGKPTCGTCGHVFVVDSRTVASEQGELVPVTPEQAAAAAAIRAEAQRLGEKKQYDALVTLGRRKGYKSPERWAMYIINGRRAKGKKHG